MVTVMVTKYGNIGYWPFNFGIYDLLISDSAQIKVGKYVSACASLQYAVCKVCEAFLA